MTVLLPTPNPLPSTAYAPATDDAGLGALATERGNLPLEAVDVAVSITGLTARVLLTQAFRNPNDVPLEATYVFPLPDRAAVTAMRMEADGRVIDGVLKERGQARADYQRAIEEGRRASIAEEERPDVFTMRVGNILPGEAVTVRLTLDQPLPYADGEATFRFPLVVAPRYVPGAPLDGPQVGSGWTADTDAVPDASRICPPVLLPGFPHPVRLSIGVDVDPGGLPLSGVRSSLHAVRTEGSHLSIQPGERADRDFVLRLGYGEPDGSAPALVLTRDRDGDDGTFQLTVLPPTGVAPPRPRDVVLVLDRSGSMSGWKMVAARRAAARIVDTLTGRDRFAVLTFDNVVDRPAGLPAGLADATDRNRFRAVEHLARTEARGGTKLHTPLTAAVRLLTGTDAAATDRDRVLVLVTDGQVGNEDRLIGSLSGALAGIRVHTVGIDRAVNAGFLTRLAVLGGGRCELVESEDRLDEAADSIHRRICAPLVTDLTLAADGLELVADTVAPARLPALFPGVPMVVTGRWRGEPGGRLTLAGRDQAGQPWSATVPATGPVDAPAVGPVWARAHLRDLEDRYLTAGHGDASELERRIVATSLRFGVLCRFTAYVAVDSRAVTDGGTPHQVVQPVEPASGWDLLASGPPLPLAPVQRTKFRPMAMDMSGDMSGDMSAGLTSMAESAAAPGAMPTSRAMAAGTARRPTLGREPGQAVSADALTWIRVQAADELRRLRAGAGLPAADRITLLADLGNRLAAALTTLPGTGAATAATGELQALVDALRVVDAGTLDELWQRAVTVLDRFAGPVAAPAPAPGPAAPTRERRAFWKR